MNTKIVLFSDLHRASPDHPSEPEDRKLSGFAPAILQRLVEAVNEQEKPDLVLCLGDHIVDTDDEEKSLALLRAVAQEFSRFEASFATCLGNHDLRTASLERVMAVFGHESPSFSFDTAGMHVVMLSTHTIRPVTSRSGVTFRGHVVSEEDLAWLRRDLAATTRPALVCLHFGVAWDEMRGSYWFEEVPESAVIDNRDALHDILKEAHGLVAVFSGHQHRTCTHVWDGVTYHVVGSLVESVDGIPDGVYLVAEWNGETLTVTEKHIRL